jgi:hypothetical protein
MKVTIVLIHWIDSTYYKYDAISLKEIEDDMHAPRELLTVGMLVSETENFITICQCIDANIEFTRKVLSIPKLSIIGKPKCIEIDVDYLKQKNKKSKCLKK